MTRVYTQFKRPKTIPVNPGDHFLNEYQEKITKDGKELVEVGKRNIWDMIQADLEQSKIENILKAVAMGDLSALQQREAIYCDATEFPKNLMEAQNLVIKAQDEFKTFPKEVRDLFHDNPYEYISEMGTESFLEKMSPYNEKLAKIKEAGSLAEYNEKVKAQAKFETDVEAAKEVKQ